MGRQCSASTLVSVPNTRSTDVTIIAADILLLYIQTTERTTRLLKASILISAAIYDSTLRYTRTSADSVVKVFSQGQVCRPWRRFSSPPAGRDGSEVCGTLGQLVHRPLPPPQPRYSAT